MRPTFFKKTTPNGKVTLYVNKREFIDHCNGIIDPVEGVISVEKNYLCGRKIFGKLTITYRYGREEDEVMGVKLSRDMTIDIKQVVPPLDDNICQISTAQRTILDRSTANQYRFPFTFQFPPQTPSSIVIQSGIPDSEKSKPLGVEYSLRAFVGESITDLGFKRSSVSIVIKKQQLPLANNLERLPSTIATKMFAFSNGKITFEMTLSKEMFYHEECINLTLLVTNTTRKSIKKIKLYVMQHVELTMLRFNLTNIVACLKTGDGCPIGPGQTFCKEFSLTPLASNNLTKRGTALDGYLKGEKKNLASSTILPAGKLVPEQIGVNVSYSVRGKLLFGILGGDVTADVPMKLVQLSKSATNNSNLFVISEKKLSKPGWKRSSAPRNKSIEEE